MRASREPKGFCTLTSLAKDSSAKSLSLPRGALTTVAKEVQLHDVL